jgi:hypothetical protein
MLPPSHPSYSDVVGYLRIVVLTLLSSCCSYKMYVISFDALDDDTDSAMFLTLLQNVCDSV